LKNSSRIVFFVPEFPSLGSSVLHSQVLSVASVLFRHGYDCLFIGVESGLEKSRIACEFIKEKYGLESHIMPFFPEKPNALTLLATTFNTFRKSQILIDGFKPTHIYSRSVFASFFGRKMAKRIGAISVFDIRASISAEVFLRRGRSPYGNLLEFIEKREFTKTDRLAAVSNNLKNYIKEKCGVDDVVVIPSCFDETKFYFDCESRKRLRNKFSVLDNEILFCYTGGVSTWQKLPQIAKLLKECMDEDDRIKVLFLSKNKSYIYNLITELGFQKDRFILESCAHDEVKNFLSAADVGILFRDDNTVNNVASPIKIAEYLACELPVLLTKGIGDYSSIIADRGLGLVFDETCDMVSQVVAFIDRDDFCEIGPKCADYAIENLTIKAHLEQYRQLYAEWCE